MKILLTNGVYDALKWICMVALPAASALTAALGEIWGFSGVTQAVLTINAFTAFLGALLGLSAAQYRKADGNG